MDRSEGTAGSVGSSNSDLLSDCVIDDCDDRDSDDVVGDDVAIIDGVIVSARECAAKRPLKQG